MTSLGEDRPDAGAAPAQTLRRGAERPQHYPRERAQGPRARPVLALVRRERVGVRPRYGSFLLGFGISFWQATIVGVVGIVISFLLCGFISLAGKRGSAPTMVLSRAAFGVNGNRLPSLLSWLLTVGWETVLTALAVLATATVFTQLGWEGGVATKVVALIVVAALIIVGGVIGFHLIMRMQMVITIVTGVLTVVYIVLVLGHIDLGAVAALPAGDVPHVIGGFVFMLTGFGLGWVNAAADYSRYLPRSTRELRASSAGRRSARRSPRSSC